MLIMRPFLAGNYFCVAVKQVLTIILIFVMGLQSIFPLALYAYYNVNQSYFATVLCVNKSKPELKCEGKCFLKKQNDKTEKEKSNEKATLKVVEPIVYPFTTALPAKQLYLVATTIYPPFLSDQYSFLLLKSCFRPPVV